MSPADWAERIRADEKLLEELNIQVATNFMNNTEDPELEDYRDELQKELDDLEALLLGSLEGEGGTAELYAALEAEAGESESSAADTEGAQGGSDVPEGETVPAREGKHSPTPWTTAMSSLAEERWPALPPGRVR